MKEKLKSAMRASVSAARFLWGHSRLCALGLLLLAVLWVFRPEWHSAAVFLRIHLFEGVVWAAATYVLLRALARREWVRVGVLTFVLGAWSFALFGLGLSPYDYVCLWNRYRTLERKDFAALPETAHERIHPLHSVRTLSNEVLADTESAAEPDVGMVDGTYRFIFAIEPSHRSYVRRMSEFVRNVVSVPVTSPSFDFSEKTREAVTFPTGEGLAWSHNVTSAAIRSLGPWRFFSYVPGDVKYLKDDAGQWVQVVSMIRWSGLFAPRQEFGGVLVIRQRSDSLISWASRALFGTGEWIRPEDVHRKKFLVGQNVVPYEVSRYAAESFRFKNGFTSPMPGWHRGDIRIPEIVEDKNPQPYTVYATWDGETIGKLWHYFGLEPYDPDKQGLSTSLFMPADGIGPVRVVHHERQGLFGVSTVPSKVRESQKVYDWTHNAPVEHRPFIRTVGGTRRLLWLTTIVTFKKGSDGDFIAGADPEITLTDAASQHVAWVNAKDPSSWMPQIEGELPKVTGEVASTVATSAPAEKAAPPAAAAPPDSPD